MMETLFDRLNGIQIAGLLSRAALDAESAGLNPASAPILPNEAGLREQIRSEYLKSIKGQAHSSAEQLKESYISWLDSFSDRVAASDEGDRSLNALADEALLPGDMYEVSFSDGYLQTLHLFEVDDSGLVNQTIRHADFDKQYITRENAEGPNGISIFAKWFFDNEKDARDDFLLVVSTVRSGLTLSIMNTFRLYRKIIKERKLGGLEDAFAAFADRYGMRFSIGDWSGTFLRYRKFPHQEFSVTVPGENRKQWTFEAIVKRGDGGFEVALALCLDVRHYNRDLARHMK